LFFEYPKLLTAIDSSGMSLRWCSGKQLCKTNNSCVAQLGAARLLLERGLALQANDEGTLALHFAVMSGDVAMVQLLLEADPASQV
jgi:hypothetical protein